MTARRPVLLGAGAVAALVGLAAALTSQAATPARTPQAAAGSAEPLAVLTEAARVSMSVPWTGTHRVVWLRGGLPRLSLVKVRHEPGAGTATEPPGPGQLAVADVLDADVLRLLDARYDLVLRYDGGPVRVVEARRPGVTGPAAVAGRFWVDTATGMVVRRDVLDGEGVLTRSSVLESVRVGRQPRPLALASSRMAAPGGTPLDDARLRALAASGWPVRRVLPGGLTLFESRLHDREGAQVLQLSYTDGLSALSLFVQQGELAREPEGTARPVGDATVWVQPGAPERIVWSAKGHTWTLVSDAPESVVEQVLQALPLTPSAYPDGVAARMWRGMAVVGGWLQPFD